MTFIWSKLSNTEKRKCRRIEKYLQKQGFTEDEAHKVAKRSMERGEFTPEDVYITADEYTIISDKVNELL